MALCLVRERSFASIGSTSVRLSDVDGDLHISVTVPVVFGGSALSGPGALSLPERGAALEQALIDKMTRMTGRRVGRVNVRYDGVEHRTQRRVTLPLFRRSTAVY